MEEKRIGQNGKKKREKKDYNQAFDTGIWVILFFLILFAYVDGRFIHNTVEYKEVCYGEENTIEQWRGIPDEERNEWKPTIPTTSQANKTLPNLTEEWLSC